MTAKIGNPEHKFFKRFCKKCKNLFLPTSKFNYVCPKCQEKNKNWRKDR